MIETGHSTHKSIMIAIREAAALYLFNRSREKDIPKIAEVFLSLENYEGERVPITEVVKEVHAISNVLQDNYLGLHLNLLVDIESLPFYKAISECIVNTPLLTQHHRRIIKPPACTQQVSYH